MVARLKSLELQGYKTFASRTLFKYPVDITAVVGPNGSGKSNIADAIRWVLGEQAYSLLRGRKTEDMIFSGSEHRSRASMASATITFDNEDGWLPIDYSEVALTRRAYRDGQNEYLLNGQRVRLREFHELLAQSGLAERTYTIIGQGLVDTALSLRPEERRKFFEEAAGIGLYRSRREEALGRLDKTRRNIERAQDILSELEPRLKSLERQARRAHEYNQVKDDLQILLRDWYGYHWHNSLKDLYRARKTLKTQEQALEEARLKQVQSEKEVFEARAKIKALRDQLNIWHGESSELHLEREKTSRSLAVLDERDRASQKQMQNLKSDLLKLEEEYQARLGRQRDIREEIENVRAEHKEAEEQLTTAKQALNTRLDEKNKIDQAIRNFRTQLVEAETKKVRLTAQLNEAKNRFEDLSRSIGNYRNAAEGYNQEIEKCREEIEQARIQQLNLEQEYQESENQLKNLQNENNAIDAKQKTAYEQKNKLETQKARLSAEISVLEQAEKSFSGLNQGAKFVLEGAKKGGLKGNFVPISNILDVPPEYEVAIAAVLGNYLDALWMDSNVDMSQVFEALGSGEKGRAVLIPNDAKIRKSEFRVPSGEGIVGIASKVVSLPEKYQNLYSSLLDHVVLVEDRESARKLQSSMPENYSVVTLQGEVFLGSGVLIVGRDGRSGMIARPRRKRELREDLRVVEQEITQLDREIENIKKELVEAQKNKKIFEAKRNHLQNELRQANKLHQQASLKLEQLRERSNWQLKQIRETESQIKRFDDKNVELGRQITSVDAEIKEFNEEIREYRNRLNAYPVGELQANVAHWSTNVAVATRALKDAEKRVQEFQGLISNNQQRRSSIEKRIDTITSEIEEIEQQRGELKVEENRLNLLLEELLSKISPAEADLNQLDAVYNALQEAQTPIRQTLAIAERHETQAQLEVTRQKESLDQMREKIQEDFGLVSFEDGGGLSGPNPLPFGSMVKQLPIVTEIASDLEENIKRLRGQLRRLGAINPDAEKEFNSVQKRFGFMKHQLSDLEKADQDLRKVISELDDLMRTEFRKTFDAVAAEFKKMFTRLFGGGSARLVLQDEENPTEGGIDIEARLPGRRTQGLSLLSGGERSLTAVALIFSLLKVSPTPFCVLDEVDAALDEANVGRFCELLKDLSQETQFIVITHNRNTVQISDVIYGVTMGRDSASQVISLKLDEVGEEMAQ